MKRFLLVLFIALGFYSQAQVYNNEWIDYNKTYYKFKVGVTGLYRINQPVLAGSGLGSVPAEQFQLWRNGQQIPIYTSIASGIFGPSDYIEFWGEMNDGKPDNVLYRNTDYQLNDHWSLQTDTAAFFLTANPSGGNFHFENTVNNVAGNTLAPEPYFMYTNSTYYKGKINPGYAASVGEYVYSASYDIGEGYTSADKSPGTPELLSLNNLRLYTASDAPQAMVTVSVSGNAINPRSIRVKLGADSIAGREVDYFDYARIQSVPIAVNKLSETSVFEIADICNVPTDRMVIHRVDLVYARKYDFGGDRNFQFTLPASTSGNYLEMRNLSYGYNPLIAPVLYDVTNGKRYVVNIDDPNLLKVVLQPSSVPRTLIVVPEDAFNISQVTALLPRNFVNYALPVNQGDYLIITHKNLLNSTDGHNYVNEYKDYRSSAPGGSYNANIYDIDELVDQFAFGIKKHPLSIRNFLRWARSVYALPLKNVFLIGHGITYDQYRAYENNPDAEKENYIPTWGQPASDMLFSSTPDNPNPQTPIGRLSVIYGSEVGSYLQKVKDYEAVQAFSSPLSVDKAWMKNVVHVVGSSDEQLGTMLSDYMTKYKGIISDSLFGAKVYTFNKSSTNPVEQLGDSQLPSLFQEGLSMVLYFGHSSSTTLAFNLEDPKSYNNPGKYPVCIMLGCNAGNFFNFNSARIIGPSTISENFMLTPQRGSIAYFASTHLGIVHYLDIYNTRTYTAITNTLYGKTFGEQIVEAIKQVYNLTSTDDYYARFHVEENTLHGDPAIKINVQPKPDYVIEEPFVRVLPSFVSVSKTSFNVKAKFINMGKVVNKNIVIEVKRQYPSSLTEVVYRDTIPPLRYADSLSIDLPIISTRDKGLNKIIVTIDADNVVDELYETNNSITKDLIIYDDDATVIYPYNYAIINKQNITFAASTADAFAPLAQYKFEVDTTELFNSSLKLSQTLSSKGGVLEFKPPITFTDSTVYYWRVAPVPAAGDEAKWSSASFVYLANSDLGFNQSHFFQHTRSIDTRMYLDTVSRTWKYKDVLQNLFLKMGTYPTSGAASDLALTVTVNSTYDLVGLTSWFQSLVFNVFDPYMFKPWVNTVVRPGATPGGDMGDGLYQSLAPQNPFQTAPRANNFEFRYTDTSSRRKIMDFMRDVVPDGYYVVVRNFTLDNATYGPPAFPASWANEWKSDDTIHGPGQSVYDYLKNAGFAGIDSFYRARPFGFVYKKNDSKFIPQWTVGEGVYDNPTLSVDCPTPDTIGYMTSPLFGPAKAWKQAKWRGTALPDIVPGDKPTVDVIGVKADSTETIIYNGLDLTQQDYDISAIDPVQFPFVKLRMRDPDSINRTPYQLRYWRVTYDPVPEGAIAPNIYLQFKDTVELGEPIAFKVAFKNVSDAAFDSLKIKMVLTDHNNVPHILPVPRHKKLPSDSTENIEYTINTPSFSGLNTLYIEVNPDNDQPEQFHFNNFGFREIYVKPDSLNPFLDVTFDGVHILNHDIVSAKPTILVKLKDEAKWMILDDTSLVTIQLKYPDGSLKQIHFGDSLKFTPAGQAPNPDNTATLEFLPHLTQDGEYQLIVSGRDKSSNVSGKIQYQVSFQVINKAMISNMLNYPNPFTTSTAFVFTVTGSEVPQNIRIQILTITGKIVRDITKEELGPLHIGRNITDFKWDGTDQYGQKLANGIYLYRVITNLNGKSLEKYKSASDNTDKYFNKGYGKMYLMR